MKRLLATLLIFLIYTCSYGQSLRNNVFYNTLNSGIGEKISMEFSIDSTSIVQIQETEQYKSWINETYLSTTTSSIEWRERFNEHSSLELYLMTRTGLASVNAKYKLKNPNSYTPINGDASVRCRDGKITIVFPMKGQNAYGNFIISKAYFTIEWVNGEVKEETFIN
jgi:hypothetical protein